MIASDSQWSRLSTSVRPLHIPTRLGSNSAAASPRFYPSPSSCGSGGTHLLGVVLLLPPSSISSIGHWKTCWCGLVEMWQESQLWYRSLDSVLQALEVITGQRFDQDRDAFAVGGNVCFLLGGSETGWLGRTAMVGC